MSPRMTAILQTICSIMLIWMVYRLLASIHGVLAWGLWVFSATNVAIIWIARFQGAFPECLSRIPFAKRYIHLICRWANVQPPRRSQRNGESEFWRCTTDQAYVHACETLQQVVRGHDDVINQIMVTIKNSMSLRKRRRKSAGSVIAAVLLAGPEGIGKTFLVQNLAQQLFKEPNCLLVDCTRESYQSLFGTPGAEGQLLQAIRQQPWQVVCLENIDTASAEIQTALHRILSCGRYVSPQYKTGNLSFENTIFCLLTTQLPVSSSSDPQPTESTQAVVEYLTREAAIHADLLQALSLTLPMSRPPAPIQAEVVAQQLIEEAGNHGLKLSFVDPLLVLSEVARINTDSGFKHLHANVRRLLCEPILEASSNHAAALSLHVHRQSEDL